MKTSEILGIKINHDLTFNDVVSLVDEELKKKSFFQICTTNPEFIVDAQNDSEFRDIINKSFLSLPDGSGVLFALDYLKQTSSLKRNILFPIASFVYGISMVSKVGKFQQFPPIYGSDLTQKLLKLANDRGYTVGLIGGSLKDNLGRMSLDGDNIAEKAANKLKHAYPNINIIVADSHINAMQTYDNTSVTLINDNLKKSNFKHIDMLFVGFGHNRQEKWINRNHYNLPVSLCMGVGGTIDDIAGYTKQPPEIFSKYNLRWLFRLINQPWRVKRILKATLLFPLLVFIDTLKQQ